jgi:DNA-directed RNA polymerase specialized sigma24 family protein
VYFPPKASRKFRNRLLKGDTNPSNRIPKDKLAEFHSELPYIVTIRNDVYADLGNRTVERAVLENFAALAKSHAKKWSREGDPNGLTFRDYLQEAYLCIVDAIYAYRRDDIEMSTFVFTALKNRMINTTNQQGNLLSPLTNDDLELMSLYEQTRRKTNQRVTFDEVVELMGLSPKKASQLNSVLTKVYAEQQLGGTKGDGDDDQFGNDYTGHRVGVDHESENDGLVGKRYVESVIKKANLNDFEKIVFAQAMEPYYGWQSDIAARTINPDTKQPYTRMRVTQVLENARNKVKRVMKVA